MSGSAGDRPIEAEVKFILPTGFDVPSLQRALRLRGYLSMTVAQEDIYLGHYARDFGSTDEALRVRSERTLPSSDGPLPPFPRQAHRRGWSTWLTYKGPKLDARSKARVEVEVSTGPTVTQALLAAGFTTVARVRKIRQSWRGGTGPQPTLEVAIDEVVGLGLFVELEQRTTVDDLEQTVDRLLQEGAELLGAGVGTERRSYLELLLRGS